ncbi:DUF4192 family protein [Nocardia takedensis]|uniref:DUF4192 family protein n=1 Tax=Nocardia takedensis TaxID=259390 RepID=UPI0002FC8B40|nr:DUF4192 family protein [Nocardia takedensis]
MSQDHGLFLADVLASNPGPPQGQIRMLMMRTQLRDGVLYTSDEGQFATALPTGFDETTAFEYVADMAQLYHHITPAFAVMIIIDPAAADPDRSAWYRDLAQRLRLRLAVTGGECTLGWLLADPTQVDRRTDLLPADTPPRPGRATTRSRRELVRASEIAAILSTRATATHPADHPAATAERALLVEKAIVAVGSGRELTAVESADLTVALTDPVLRVHLLRTTLGNAGPITMPLWRVLVDGLPAGHRALPALMLALDQIAENRELFAHRWLRIARADRPADPTLTRLLGSDRRSPRTVYDHAVGLLTHHRAPNTARPFDTGTPEQV